MRNCGWCGEVDQEHVENCKTDDCAMKASTVRKCGCCGNCGSVLDKSMPSSVECRGDCKSCACKEVNKNEEY